MGLCLHHPGRFIENLQHWTIPELFCIKFTFINCLFFRHKEVFCTWFCSEPKKLWHSFFKHNSPCHHWSAVECGHRSPARFDRASVMRPHFLSARYSLRHLNLNFFRVMLHGWCRNSNLQPFPWLEQQLDLATWREMGLGFDSPLMSPSALEELSKERLSLWGCDNQMGHPQDL